MRRILFQQTDFNSLPNPPAGFKYIGFNGPNFSEKDEDGQINQNLGATGPQGPPSQDQGNGEWHIPVSPDILQSTGNYLFTSPSGMEESFME